MGFLDYSGKNEPEDDGPSGSPQETKWWVDAISYLLGFLAVIGLIWWLGRNLVLQWKAIQ